MALLVTDPEETVVVSVDKERLAPDGIRIFKRYESVRMQRTQLTRSIILKAPGTNGEKGVLAMLFEYNWYRLLHGLRDLRGFTRQYDLLLCTSWSPTHYPLLACLLAQSDATLYVQACNYGEIAKIEALHPRLKCVPFIGCDWVLPEDYHPLPHHERVYDFAMVANWAPFKRHYEFFQALSRMPANLRIVLIGQPEGGFTSDHIRQLAKDLRVPQKLNIFEGIPIHKVREIQCKSKAAVIFSRREGCCVAAVEALFADAPLGMRDDAHVGPLDYINSSTGRRLSTAKPMHLQLMDLLEASSKMHPRNWAIENVSCHVTLRKLNEFLRKETLASGRPWSTDLAPVCWAPYPTYLHECDRERLRSVYEDLHEQYPDVFAADLLVTSHR